jgi:inner membrane protein involved in colicin E2 resistance
MQLEGRDLIAITDINKAIGGEYNPDAQLKTEPWPLPLNFRIGIAMDILGGQDALVPVGQNRLTLAVDWNHPNDNLERVNFGSEYAWNETFFARAGYKLNYDVSSFTFGAGVRIAIDNQWVDFDYALVDYEDLGQVSRLSLELKF